MNLCMVVQSSLELRQAIESNNVYKDFLFGIAIILTQCLVPHMCETLYAFSIYIGLVHMDNVDNKPFQCAHSHTILLAYHDSKQ
jgi:hypothetical protein